MSKEAEGRYCLINKEGEDKKGKILKTFVQSGGVDHGQEFAVVILDDSSLSLWDRELTWKLKDLKLID